MAINQPGSSTGITTRKYDSPADDTANAMLMEALKNAHGQSTASLQSFLAGKLDKQKLDNSIQGQKDLKEAKTTSGAPLVPEGASTHAGDTTIGVSPELAHQQKTDAAMTKETGALNKASKGTLDPIKGQLDALNSIHSLLKDPNSIDAQQLSTAMARLSEGQGQRMLQHVIQISGGDPTLAGDATKAANYFTGGAIAKLQPDQKDAIQQNLFKHQSLIEKQLADAGEQFKAQAPMMAPTLARAGKLEEYANNTMAPLQKRLGELQSHKQEYDKAHAMAAAAPSVPHQASGLFDRLKNSFMQSGPGQAATAAPKVPHPQDAEALQWAKGNPSDPRAVQIIKMSGGQ